MKTQMDSAATAISFEETKKLSLRERYLLEREHIKNEFGDLNQMLGILGLSQRKACQLLLVDPSAWTRWNRFEAPPHIYQALKWMIQLKRANPESLGPSNLSSRVELMAANTQAKLNSLETNLKYLEKSFLISSSRASDQVLSELKQRESLLLKQIQSMKKTISVLRNKRKLKAVKSKKIIKKKKSKPRKKVLTTKKKKRRR